MFKVKLITDCEVNGEFMEKDIELPFVPYMPLVLELASDPTVLDTVTVIDTEYNIPSELFTCWVRLGLCTLPEEKQYEHLLMRGWNRAK